MVLLSLLVPYCFFLLSSKSAEHVYSRYVLPILPVLFLYAGWALDEISSHFKINSTKKIVTTAILIVAIAIPLYDTVIFNLSLAGPDTRTEAKSWFDQNVSSEAIVVIEGSFFATSHVGPPLPQNPKSIEKYIQTAISKESENIAEMKNSYYDAFISANKNKPKTYNLIFTYHDPRLTDVIEHKLGDYVVVRERSLKRFKIPENQKLFPRLFQLAQLVESGQFQLIKQFKKERLGSGENLFVFKRGLFLK
jgi:hypothetical protein